MSAITLDLIRRRAEHNSGIVATLEELSLHGNNIEKIELLNQACRHLRILYLQNNVIGRIENVHKLKELEYLNLALNNVQLVENLGGCESLAKLDLTANFIGAPRGLLSVAELQHNRGLSELFLAGNPCAKHDGYRDFVIATLPQLTRLDGTDVTPKERIKAAQALPSIRAQLEAELAAELPKPAESDGGEESWGPEARLRQHREDAAEREAREAARKEQAMRLLSGDGSAPQAPPPKRTALDVLAPDAALPPQKNEGAFQYTLNDSADGSAVVLEVAVGRYMDTAEIQVDVQPLLVRCLVRGRLLQVHTPEEVRPGDSSCQRSTVTGSLVVTMRKVGAVVAASAAQPQPKRPGGAVTSLHVMGGAGSAQTREAFAVPHAVLTAVHGDEDLDAPPPLLS